MELAQRGVKQAQKVRDGEDMDMNNDDVDRKQDETEVQLANRARDAAADAAAGEKYASVTTPHAKTKLIHAMALDSDDVIENFTSSQWGKGTTELVNQHYQTVQQSRNKDKLNDVKTQSSKGGAANARNKKDGKLKSGALSGNGQANGNDPNGDQVTSEDLKQLILALENDHDLKK